MRDLLLLTHFTGLVVGAGAAFSLWCVGLYTRSYDSDLREQLLLSLFRLRYISYIGLILQLTSGVMLLIPFLPVIDAFPLFKMKMIAVAGITLLAIYGLVVSLGVSPRSSATTALLKLGRIGKINIVLGLIAATCSVYTFH